MKFLSGIFALLQYIEDLPRCHGEAIMEGLVTRFNTEFTIISALAPLLDEVSSIAVMPILRALANPLMFFEGDVRNLFFVA